MLAALGITVAAWASLLVVSLLGVAAGLVGVAALALGQLCLVAVPVLAARIAKRGPAALGLSRPRWQHVVGAVLVGLGAWNINLALVSLLPVPEHQTRLLQQLIDRPSLPVALIAIAVVPAICEEVVFRGVLLRGLASRLYAPVAVVLSAMAFAVYHLNPIQMLPTLLLGLAFGTIALRAGSSLPTMLAHALNNTFALLVARGDVPAFASTTGSGWLYHHPMLMFAGATVTTTAGLAIALAGPRAAIPNASLDGRLA